MRPFEGYTLSEILSFTRGRHVNSEEVRGKDFRVRFMAPLESAKSTDVSFFFSKKYQSELIHSKPGILVTGEAFVAPLSQSQLPVWNQSAVIACADPYGAMAVLSEKFALHLSSAAHIGGDQTGRIHPTAVIDSSARIAPNVQIGAHVVIEKNVEVGAETVIYPGCFLGENVAVGQSCVLFPKVTLYEQVSLGNRVRIHAGAVLGADGFGYAPDVKAGKVVAHRKIYHLGRVKVGDDVEIGANTCIDRGTLKDTCIGNHCKIDNHVMIGHNVILGEGVVVCGSVGIAGSAEIGNFVYIGGLSAISNGVKIGAYAKLGGGSFVARDIPSGEAVAGHPHRKFRDFLKLQILMNRMLEEQKK